MISRKPYFKESTSYVSFKFETKEEATMFREMCELLGMKTDKKGYSGQYATVVYILNVDKRLED